MARSDRGRCCCSSSRGTGNSCKALPAAVVYRCLLLSILPTYLPFCLPANRRALEEGYVCVCVCNVCLDDAWRSLPPGAAAALSARRHAFDRYHGEYSVCTLSVQCRAIGTGHCFESIPPLWTQQLQQLSDTLETRIFVYLSLLSGR